MAVTEQTIIEAKSEIIKLYQITDRLNALFPHRPFPLDGHLVGSLGEVLAAYYFELELTKNPVQCDFDALALDERKVQIKATQSSKARIGIRSQSDWLLVLLLHRNADVEEVYNGPGAIPWALIEKQKNSNGQHQISLSRLKELQKQIDKDDQYQKIRRR